MSQLKSGEWWLSQVDTITHCINEGWSLSKMSRHFGVSNEVMGTALVALNLETIGARTFRDIRRAQEQQR